MTKKIDIYSWAKLFYRRPAYFGLSPSFLGQKGPALELQTGQSEIIVKWSFGTTNLITGFELSYIRVPSAYYWHDIQKVQLKPEARDYVIKHIQMSKIHRIELRIKSGPVISKPSVAVYIADKRAVILEDWRRLKVGIAYFHFIFILFTHKIPSVD